MPGVSECWVATVSTMRFPRGHFGVTTEAGMGDDYEKARTMIEEARRDDALGRAMRASIEQQIAGGAEAAEHVHIEKGDTMWNFTNRVLDAVQEDEKKGDREP